MEKPQCIEIFANQNLPRKRNTPEDNRCIQIFEMLFSRKPDGLVLD
jgi:hypothetical protein